MPTTPLPCRAFRENAARDGSVAHSPKAARPTLLDLMVGKPFADGSPEADAATLAGWLLEHTEARSIPDLHLSLHLLACAQTPASLANASAACRTAAENADVGDDAFVEAAGLFDYYGACLGDADAALRVATSGVAAVLDAGIDARTALERGLATLGWLWFAASPPGCTGTVPVRTTILHAAEDILDRMTESRRAPLRRSTLARPPDLDVYKVYPPDFPELVEALSDCDGHPEVVVSKSEVVVLHRIGNPETGEGKRVATTFRGVVRTPLPLVPMPDLVALHRGLLAEYPHAHAAIDAVVGELVGEDHVALPPLVLAGPPGAGKTQLATSLVDALGLVSSLVSCGGANDSSLAGTSRRWSTGEPSTPMALIAAHRTASPAIILDELDKPAGADTNGRLHDALLGMLEPVTAARWHDPYLEAEVDLSHVVWLATVNDASALPRPLRDRCRILSVPLPGPEHLAGLSASLLRRHSRVNGRHPASRPLAGRGAGGTPALAGAELAC